MKWEQNVESMKYKTAHHKSEVQEVSSKFIQQTTPLSRIFVDYFE